MKVVVNSQDEVDYDECKWKAMKKVLFVQSIVNKADCSNELNDN